MELDKIHLRGMRFVGYHGTRPEERSLGQQFVVDVTLFLDLQAAGRTDDLQQTVDYSQVHQRTRQIVEGEPLQLTEAVAERIAAAVLADHLRVQAVQVQVTKPWVRLEDTILDGSVVEIVRRRG
ncbi:dihydroneopterin aldolase [Candidatus Chloroploca asiatica]|uniref:7,8-dihydroneopterin aldolase n=1 Tax=Candidatus Chloroploca asiatica TaxID=1506545 RepID=A0A2H3KWH7_9CHLR|nr:dihydroneopterin aldolase [Candidatus Chloroploca asiatica]PDV96721.1 dihydroneopterin aldolase [Candidatus Chloroploca asiatica]